MSDQRETRDYLDIRLGRHANDEQSDEAVERVWREFWVPILFGDPMTAYDEAINFTQLKKELFDAHQLMRNTSLLMDNLTMGAVSKPMTDPQVVYEIAQERFQDSRDRDWHEWLESKIDEHDHVVIQSLIEEAKAEFPVSED